MTRLIYTTVPAPSQADHVQLGGGLSGQNVGLSLEMTAVLNSMAEKGWTFLRSETLPFTERRGLLRRKVLTEQSVLIFYREDTGDSDTTAKDSKTSASKGDKTAPSAPTPLKGVKKTPTLTATSSADDTTAAPKLITPKPIKPLKLKSDKDGDSDKR